MMQASEGSRYGGGLYCFSSEFGTVGSSSNATAAATGTTAAITAATTEDDNHGRLSFSIGKTPPMSDNDSDSAVMRKLGFKREESVDEKLEGESDVIDLDQRATAENNMSKADGDSNSQPRYLFTASTTTQQANNTPASPQPTTTTTTTTTTTAATTSSSSVVAATTTTSTHSSRKASIASGDDQGGEGIIRSRRGTIMGKKGSLSDLRRRFQQPQQQQQSQDTDKSSTSTSSITSRINYQ